MRRLAVFDAPIEGLKIVERVELSDSRGFFSRLFCADELAIAGWSKPISQINQTVTKKRGAVRGMHFQQPPFAEMKLVTCLHGAVWDVALDLRVESPTFLQWHAQELSATNHRAFLIPEGFAHGFQTLSDDCELLYLHSMPYSHDAEAGLHPNDPRLAIRWPLPLGELSARDAQHSLLDDQFKGVTL